MQWRLFLEDFGVQLHYIKGESNHLADALSRLPFYERQPPATSVAESSRTPSDDPLQSFYSMAIDNGILLDCFVNLPSSKGIPFVLDYKTIGDARLAYLRDTQADKIVNQLLPPGISVACYYILQPHAPWKIFLPISLVEHTVRWCH